MSSALISGLTRVARVFATGIGFVVFGFCSLLVTLILVLVLAPLPIPTPTKTRWTRRSITRSTRVYLQVLCVIGLIKLEFAHIERLNRPGQLVVANHPTLMDALMLMSVMPNATFVMKSAVTKNVFVQRIAHCAGYLSNIQRGHEFIDKAVAAIADGETLVIFPEGTRTIDPHNMEFQRGAANIALRARCTIQPVVIACNPPILRKNEPWYKVPARTPRCQIHALEPFNASACVDPQQPASIQARELTRHLQQTFTRELHSRS